MSDGLIKALLKQHKGQLFATASSEYTKDALMRADFRIGGKDMERQEVDGVAVAER